MAIILLQVSAQSLNITFRHILLPGKVFLILLFMQSEVPHLLHQLGSDLMAVRTRE